MSSSLISRIVRLGAHTLVVAALVVTFLGIRVSGTHVVSATADRPPRAMQSEYGQLPLSFIANAGQVEPEVRFQVRGTGGTLSFEEDGVTLSLPIPHLAPAPALLAPLPSHGSGELAARDSLSPIS